MIARRDFLLLSFFGVTSLVHGRARAASFVLVRNAQNPTSRVTRAEAKQLFTGGTKIWNKAVVQPILREEGTPELTWLASSVFGGSPRDLLTRIKQEIFRGEMKRPIVAKSTAECLAAVAQYPGGIGVVDEETARALPSGVAVLVLQD